ncbi:MAG: serine/threonine-protein kinase [Kofleriaceae bacterium]
MAVDLLETEPAGPEDDWSDTQIGRYVLRRFVGAGGMGVVFAAHDPELDREVAIKMFATESETARPIREAQAMARLSHPNVVQIHEVIRLGPRTAIVMELVEGEELGAWQRERSWVKIIDAYVQASRGLAAAHRAGIVHRDFKPSNALVDRDGVVRVTDFGIALRAARDPREGISVGTPVYMAPEQHRGDELDARTDQWALGCALYEALHGRRPFASAEAGGLAAAVIRGQIEEEPADSSVPRRIRAAIRRALSTDPDDRFTSIADFAAALSATPRHVRYVIGAALVTALVVTLMVTRRSGPEPCADLDAPMRAVWTDAARASLRARLLASGVGLPEPAVDRSLRGLDAYAAGWATTRTQACRDSRQGVRSAEALDARMRCLDHRLAEASGLLDALIVGAPPTLRATSDAVAQLEPAATCNGATDLVARPRSPAIDNAERELARATALVSLGQFEQALALVERAAEVGGRSGDSSLVARALLVRGECEDRLGRHAASLATFQRGANVAAQARDHVSVAAALSHAFLVEGDHLGHRADALRSRRFVELALESAGQPDAVRADWLHYLAILLYDDPSVVDEAAAHERESLAIRQKTLPPNHVYIFDSLETLANIEAVRKNFDESTRLLHRVLQARIEARGPTDFLVASAYNNLGVVEIRRNNTIAAVDFLQRGVDIARAAGQLNPNAMYNLGVAQVELGRLGAAATSFSATLEIADRLDGKDSRHAGDAAMFLGVVWMASGDFSRGGPMLVRGLDGVRRSASPSLATALSHAARLALHDGERLRARLLLDEAMKLPSRNKPLRLLVAAEIAHAEKGCAVARAMFASAFDAAVSEGERFVQSAATVALASCELATGDVPAARARLVAELAWFEKASADDIVRAPALEVLARIRSRRPATTARTRSSSPAR